MREVTDEVDFRTHRRVHDIGNRNAYYGAVWLAVRRGRIGGACRWKKQSGNCDGGENRVACAHSSRFSKDARVYASSASRKYVARESIETRVCSLESRSRTVTSCPSSDS